MTQHQC